MIDVAAPEKVVTVTPYKAEDALSMPFTRQAAQSLMNVNAEKTFRDYEKLGPAWTLRVNGTIVGCAGLMIPWPGVAHAWLLPSVTIGTYPKTVVQLVVATLYDLLAKLNLRRIDCEVEMGFTVGHRFVQALGFVPFGPVKERWGPNDNDYQPYVILQPRDTELPHVA